MVRQMMDSDVQQVYELSCSCFSEPWSLASIQKEVDNPVAIYYVAEKEGRIVGYAGLWHVLEEGEIINIAVASSYRRQGVAQALLDDLMKFACSHNIQIIHLEVRSSNISAQHLYEKYGFKKIAIRKGYYQNPKEDAIIMEWKMESVTKL